MVEIVQDCPAIAKFFAVIASAARDWDGDLQSLLREMGTTA